MDRPENATLSIIPIDFEDETQEEFAPFVWLDRKKLLKKKFGYLDQELTKSRQINKPINVIFTIAFDDDKSHGIRSVQFSPLGQHIVAGCVNGDIHIVNCNGGEIESSICDKNHSPISSIKFISTNPDFFVTSTQAGKVFVSDVNTTDMKIFCTEPNNEIFSMDISNAGDTLATAGYDATLRIYDTCTEKLLKLYGGNEKCHRMKIRCVIFNPNWPNLIATGGWDNCVKLWDIRDVVTKPIRNFNGPQIHGDAIDFHDQEMLTGSSTLLNGLSIWDITSGRLIQNINLANVLSSLEGEYYSCVKYYKNNPSGNIILACGRGRCALDVIDVNEMKILGSVRMKKHVETFDSLDYVAMGGRESILKVLELSYCTELFNYK